MGMFGSAQDQVDLDDLRSRITKLEAAVASLQAQLAAGVGGGAVGGVPYGAPPPAPAGAGGGGGGGLPAAPPPPAVPSAGALPTEGTWLAEVRTLREDGKT